MSRMQVPLTRPYTGSEEKALLSQVVDSGWLTQGPQVAAFERIVAEYVGAKHAVACSNCTTALHLALMLHEVHPGDEVVVPSYTWIATANAVRMVGATPVFADIDPDTFNVTPDTIEAAVTPRTKAILPVHQFGLPADIDGITDLARRHNLIVIEDAACAIGSRYKGRPVGGHGNTACFSFHPRKLITTGEGGMLVTNEDDLAARARVLLNHGASVSDFVKHRAGAVEALLGEEFHEVGYNYRLTNLQGALGVAQMNRLNEILTLRAAAALRYTKAFQSEPDVIPPTIPDYATPNWQSYAVRIRNTSASRRNRVAQGLLDAGIACRPAYMACHVQPAYRASNRALPNTEGVMQEVIILPLYAQMTNEEQQYVVDHLARAAKELGPTVTGSVLLGVARQQSPVVAYGRVGTR